MPHQFLGVNTTVRLPKRDVPLPRNRTHRVIDRHLKPPKPLFLKISAKGLLPFDRLKQSLEVPLAEALGAFALNDLVEQRGPVLHRLAEDLEQVTLVVS